MSVDKIKILEKVLVYDRLLRFNIDLLNGIRMEIKADIEETKILEDAFLKEKESEFVRNFLLKIETEFLSKLEEVLDSIYDEYEVFNFDITFLSSIPEEVERDINRLGLVSTLNSKLELLRDILSDACCIDKLSTRLKVILTPFKVYCELINHGIEFNKKFENI